MKPQDILIAVGISFGFNIWPIMAKYSKAPASWTGTVALGVTALVTAMLSFREFMPVPAPRAIGILALGGVINGVAIYFYSAKVTDPSVLLGSFLMTVVISSVAWIPTLDWALNGSVPRWDHLLGYACASAAIYLLCR